MHNRRIFGSCILTAAFESYQLLGRRARLVLLFAGPFYHNLADYGGSLSVERTHKLCGDHLEHVYAALRITTHGVQCTALQWGTDPDVLIASTSSNCIGECIWHACMLPFIYAGLSGPPKPVLWQVLLLLLLLVKVVAVVQLLNLSHCQ